MQFQTMIFRAGVIGAGLVLSGLHAADACGVQIQWKANMKSAKIVPPVKSASTAVAKLKWRFPEKEATVFVDSQKLQAVTSVELHVAGIGKNGPAIFTLYTQSNGAWSNHLAADINPSQLHTHPEIGINNYADAITAIASQNVYVVISTKAHPAGEIRGQIQIIQQKVFSAANDGLGHDPKLHRIAQAAKHE